MPILPEELAQLRSESGLTQTAMAELLNNVLDMHYTGTSISQWERGHKPIPDYVQEAIANIAGGNLEASVELTPSTEEGTPDDSPRVRRPDVPPKAPEETAKIIPLPVSASTAMEAAATEMFRGIGQTIEMVGAFSGGAKVVDSNSDGIPDISLIELDGRTIANDAEKLGAAWAHLAESNAWVARIITSLTTGGAWVEVIMVTSQTAFSIYQNHAGYARFIAEQNSRPQPTPEPAEQADGVL